MSKRILVIDDSSLIRQMVGATLTCAGFEVLEVEDGSKGLQRATAETFDMVLNDINWNKKRKATDANPHRRRSKDKPDSAAVVSGEIWRMQGRG